MAAHLLKDKTGKSWYDDEPFKVNFYDGYNGFLTYLSELSRKFIVSMCTPSTMTYYSNHSITRGLSMETYLMGLTNTGLSIMAYSNMTIETTIVD